MDKPDEKKPRVLELDEVDITPGEPTSKVLALKGQYAAYKRDVIGDKTPTPEQEAVLAAIADKLLDDEVAVDRSEPTVAEK